MRSTFLSLLLAALAASLLHCSGRIESSSPEPGEPAEDAGTQGDTEPSTESDASKRAGSDAAKSSDTGVSKTAGDAGACADGGLPGFDACYGCCKAAHPTGYQGFRLIMYGCACSCGDDCGPTNLCSGNTEPHSACGACMQGIVPGRNATTCADGAERCGKDANCAAFAACASGCSIL